MPEHIFEKVDEVWLKERVFRELAFGAVVEKVLVKRVAALEIAEVVFSALVFQIAPVNELGERNRKVLINVPATGSKLSFDQVEQRLARARNSPVIEIPWIRRIKRGRVINPAPGGGRMPKRSIAPGLARHCTEPVIEDREFSSQLAQHWE